MMLNARRILITDRDPRASRLLRYCLEQARFHVLAASDGQTALDLVYRARPDLLILDAVLPDRDGWEIIRTLRAEPSQGYLPIIMLTSRATETDKITGLELGADDCVSKPFNPDEVVARVRAVLRRTRAGAEADTGRVLEYRDIRMDVTQHWVTLNDQAITLTPTEFNLLYTFLDNPRQVFTRDELITHSRGFDSECSDHTITSHIKNLRKKIEPDPEQAAYIHTVYGVGYRLEST